jgi:protein O-mannosyl-transferase
MAKKAITLKPDYAAAYNNIGSAYNILGNYKEAVTALEKALAIEPGFTLAANNLAQAKTNLAIQTGTTSSTQQLDPDALINLSLSQFNQGNYRQCILTCKKVLEIQPGNGSAYNNICAAYNQLKQWDSAIIVGKEGLKYIPDNQLLKNNIAFAQEEQKKSR